MNQYFVYILASQKNGVLYVGVTSNLKKRIYDHKSHFADSFTTKYKVTKLVYFEETSDVQSAILREKRIKKWNRKWKIRLIKQLNPDWNDLFPELLMNGSPTHFGEERQVLPESAPRISASAKVR